MIHPATLGRLFDAANSLGARFPRTLRALGEERARPDADNRQYFLDLKTTGDYDALIEMRSNPNPDPRGG